MFRSIWNWNKFNW